MSSNSPYVALIDSLKDLATPDNVILNSQESLSERDIFMAADIRIKKLLSLRAYAFLVVNDDFEFSLKFSFLLKEKENLTRFTRA